MERLTGYDNVGGMKVGDLLCGVDSLTASDLLAQYEDTDLTPDQILQLKKECDELEKQNEYLKRLLELALQEIERFYELNSSIKIVTFKLPEIKFDLTLDENDRQIWKYANDVKEILKND